MFEHYHAASNNPFRSVGQSKKAMLLRSKTNSTFTFGTASGAAPRPSQAIFAYQAAQQQQSATVPPHSGVAPSLEAGGVVEQMATMLKRMEKTLSEIDKRVAYTA